MIGCSYKEDKVEGVTFNLGPKTGGLIVYTNKDLRGKSLELSIDGNWKKGTLAANVVGRSVNGSDVYAAVFPSLPVGTHTLAPATKLSAKVTIFAGQVAEVDKR